MPRMSPRLRKIVLAVHIVGSVGLIGAVAVLVLMTTIAATTDDTEYAASIYDLASLETAMFGIPLSFVSLFSGLALGLGTKWGVLRYKWTAIKLALNLSVPLCGAFVTGPGIEEMRDDLSAGAEWQVVAGAAWNASAFLIAATLGVFKPGGRLRRQRAGQAARSGLASSASK